MAACVICYYLFVLGAATSKALHGRARSDHGRQLGNCYDRLMLGHVRDFVHLHVDPIGFDCAIFNFADNMLIAGAITLVIFASGPRPLHTSTPVAGAGRARRGTLERRCRPDRASLARSSRLAGFRAELALGRLDLASDVGSASGGRTGHATTALVAGMLRVPWRISHQTSAPSNSATARGEAVNFRRVANRWLRPDWGVVWSAVARSGPAARSDFQTIQ